MSALVEERDEQKELEEGESEIYSPKSSLVLQKLTTYMRFAFQVHFLF